MAPQVRLLLSHVIAAGLAVAVYAASSSLPLPVIGEEPDIGELCEGYDSQAALPPAGEE